MKIIDLRLDVYTLIKAYPELASIMNELGFIDITSTVMLNSISRVVTIPKCAKIKNISLDKIIEVLKENDFLVVGLDKNNNSNEEVDKEEEEKADEGIVNSLMSYLERLKNKVDIRALREEFKKEFVNTDFSLVTKAEENLLSSGIPLKEVKKLCLLHSVLFHNEEEKTSDTSDELIILLSEKGHPLNLLSRENAAIKEQLDIAKSELNSSDCIADIAERLLDISLHYAKKIDLIYPLLKNNYSIYGPYDVMLTIDLEILDELKKISENRGNNSLKLLFSNVLSSAYDMIYKEEHILFPLVVNNFKNKDWVAIYTDLKGYENCFGINSLVWDFGEKDTLLPLSLDSNKISLPTGILSLVELNSMLNAVPMEITFIDENNINKYFNSGYKIFKRAVTSLGQDIFSSHTSQDSERLRQIIEEFKSDRLDSVPVWIIKDDKNFLVQYIAVRDNARKYVGTLELVQDMSLAKDFFTSPQNHD